jgi:hypothetical protein
MAISATQIIEGTWEEVSQQGEKFSGHRVRVMILPDEEPAAHPNAPLLALIAQWEKEDAEMSSEEAEKINALYDKIEKNGIPRLQIGEPISIEDSLYD